MDKEQLGELVQAVSSAVDTYADFTKNNIFYEDEEAKVSTTQKGTKTARYVSPHASFTVAVNTNKQEITASCQYGSGAYTFTAKKDKCTQEGVRPVFLEPWACFDQVFANV